ncbi:response regulator (plasmid) [Bradyrhizobium barranii]|uniref:Response regulator n=1 Tax=Bradyrhizobium barranii TaxID=2992140 RepID=A0ABY3R319_9BRAD|nr:response regulator [Bradyrhizobium japonicum]UFW92244.1 response regulator [Bradyrhizobium japonicum]
MDTKVGSKSVHVVDDDTTFSSMVEGHLTQLGYTVQTFASPKHLLDQLPSDALPSCIILDVRLPSMSGPELQLRLKELGSTLPIVFVTGYPDVQMTVRTIKAGGTDFLLKPVPPKQLVEAVERAISHHSAVLADRRAREASLSHLATLTLRERQVLDGIVRGNTNAAIAEALGITERTVKAHRQMVMDKMQIRTVVELVVLAQRLGILDH